MKALENFSVYTLGNILQTAVGFLLLPIYIKYLSPAEYGVISVILAVSSILIVTTNLGAASGFYRLYYEGPKEKLFTTTLLWRLSTAFLAFILIVFISKRLSLILFRTESYQLPILFGGLFVLISPCRQLFFLTLRLRQLAKKFVAYSLFCAMANFTLKFIYVVLLKRGISGFWIAQVLAELLTTVVIFFHAKMIYMIKKPSLSLLKGILKLGFPWTFSTLGSWIINSSDKLLLNAFVGPSVVGIYTLAIRISSLFGVILNKPVALWWGPFALEKSAKEGIDSFKEIDKKFLNIASTGGFLAIPIISVLGLIVAILPGYPGYKGAIFLVPFCLVPPLLYLMMHPFSIQFLQAKRTQYAGWGGTVAAGTNLGVNFLLIPLIGVWGAIISSIIAYSFWLMIYYVGGQKSLHIDYEWSVTTRNFSIFLLYEMALVMVLLFKRSVYLQVLAGGSIGAIIALVISNYKFLKSFASGYEAIAKNYMSKTMSIIKESLEIS